MMENKSVAYMLVAVLIGVTLITAVPDQIARYATPKQMLSIESGDAGSQTLPKVGEGSVELSWDSTSAPEDNSTDDQEIWFDIANSTHGGPWNGTVEGLEFSVSPKEGVTDLNNDVTELAEQLEDVSGEFNEVQGSIADVSALAADAVAAAEAASDAVTAVAATANTASEAAADAAEAANAARGASSGLKTISMFAWYALDALIAFGVYILAKRRFG